MALEATTIIVDVPKVAAYGFGPLSAVLGDISAIYTDHKVRSPSPIEIPLLLTHL